MIFREIFVKVPEWNLSDLMSLKMETLTADDVSSLKWLRLMMLISLITIRLEVPQPVAAELKDLCSYSGIIAT